METRIMHPEIIVYSLIITAVLLLAWRKKNKYKNGIVVANTKYVKKTSFYKKIRVKYIIYNILIIVISVALIGISATLTARLYKEDKNEDIKEYYNRDIVLCLDFSGSMKGIINNIIDDYIKIVEKLDGDRFGIVVFGGAPATVLPLTDDYNYAITILKKLKTSSPWSWAGMRAYNCCSSSDGDGLAASVLMFDKDNDRTKVVVLAADHGVGSDYIVSLNEAAEIAKNYNVKVYYVDGEGASRSYTYQEKVNAASITGGKHYDVANMSVEQIIKDIDSLDKTLLVEKNVELTRIDLPELIFNYLLYLIPLLFILDWRVGI